MRPPIQVEVSDCVIITSTYTPDWLEPESWDFWNITLLTHHQPIRRRFRNWSGILWPSLLWWYLKTRAWNPSRVQVFLCKSCPFSLFGALKINPYFAASTHYQSLAFCVRRTCLVTRTSFLMDSTLLLCPPVVDGARGLSQASFVRVMIPNMRVLPAWLNHLLKGSTS